MNKKEVEETLKNTINYSNSELKRKKKKYMAMSSIVIAIVVLISSIALIYINKNKDIGAIVDRDTIYDISYYSDYKTSIYNTNGEKLELIIMKLPLNWRERQLKIIDNIIEINYNVSYKEVVKAYNDEDYVKEAMINNASIIFTTISGVDSVEIRYTDYRYSISKDKLLKAYNISDFDKVIEKDNWDKLVLEKLIDEDFVNDTFKFFDKSEVSKKEIDKEPIAEGK